MIKRLKFLLFPQFTDQTIPIRTEIAEIFGKFFTKRHKIISIIKSKSHEQHIVWHGIDCYNLPLLKFIIKSYRLAKSQKFNIIYTRDSFFLLLFGYLIKRKYKGLLMFHIISPINYLTELYYKWYHPRTIASYIINVLIFKLMKKVDLILPTSKWMKKYLISQGIDANKIHNFPNGANLDLFKASSPESFESPVYIYSGTMAKIRKLEIIIKAFKLVCEHNKKSHLLMVGDGDGLSDLKDLTNKLNLDKNITFTGLLPYDEVPKYIAKAQIALSPIPPIFYYEVSSPLKLFEYMCNSRPVIANRGIPSHVETIRENNCGILVDYTPKSFAEAMIYLFKNPEKVKIMGENGRKWIKNNRSYEILAKNLEKRIMEELNRIQ